MSHRILMPGAVAVMVVVFAWLSIGIAEAQTRKGAIHAQPPNQCQVAPDGQCFCGTPWWTGTGRQIPCRREFMRQPPAPDPIGGDPSCRCPSSGAAQGESQQLKIGQSTIPRDGAAGEACTCAENETSDCRVANRPNTVLVLRTALDVARCIFDLYNTGFPILIGRSDDFPIPTCVMLLSGTEPTRWEQATNLLEDIGAAANDPYGDRFHLAILSALIDMRNRGICRQARLIMAGHSLGGMEAQNIAVDGRVTGAGFEIGDIVTFGSPATVELPRYVPRERFTTIGDTIPYSTRGTGTFRPVEQKIVSDLQGEARMKAIAKANREERANFPVVNIIWLLSGAVGPHMQYLNVQQLAQFDAIGKPASNGVTLRVRNVRHYSAPRN